MRVMLDIGDNFKKKSCILFPNMINSAVDLNEIYFVFMRLLLKQLSIILIIEMKNIFRK